MKKNKRIWSWALACALAISNLSAVVTPLTSIVAQAANPAAAEVEWNNGASGYILKTAENITLKASVSGLDSGKKTKFALVGTYADASVTETEVTADSDGEAKILDTLVLTANNEDAAIVVGCYYDAGSGYEAEPYATITLKGYSSVVKSVNSVTGFTNIAPSTRGSEATLADLASASGAIRLTGLATTNYVKKGANDCLTWAVYTKSEYDADKTKYEKYKKDKAEYDAQVEDLQNRIDAEEDLEKKADLQAELAALGGGPSYTDTRTNLATMVHDNTAAGALAGTEKFIVSDYVAPQFTGDTYKQVVYLNTKSATPDSYVLVVHAKGEPGIAADPVYFAVEAADANFKIGYKAQASDKTVTQTATAYLVTGDTLQLYPQRGSGVDAYIITDSAELSKVTWSSDKAFATVDANGLVTAVGDSSDAKVTITGKFTDGNVVSTCDYEITEVIDPAFLLSDVGSGTATTGVADKLVTAVTATDKSGTVHNLPDIASSSDMAYTVYTSATGSTKATNCSIENGVFKATAAGTYFVDASWAVTDELTVNVTGGRYAIAVKDPTPVVTAYWTDSSIAPANFTPTAIGAAADQAAIGDEFKYVVKILDNDITKAVEWTSNNTKVATVEDGVVTITGAGKATITAKYDDTKITTIAVDAKAESYSIKGLDRDGEEQTATLKLWKDDETDLVLYKGKTAYTGDFTWKSADDKLVGVDDNGHVYAIKDTGAGGINVTAVDEDSNIIATMNVVVENVALNIKVDGKAITPNGTSASYITGKTPGPLTVGEEVQFTAFYGNKEVTEDGTWSVTTGSDVSVKKGLVKGLSISGSTNVVTFAYDNSTKINIDIDVVAKNLTLTAPNATISVGESAQLVAKNGNMNITKDSNISFKSADEDYVTVTEDGVITGVADTDGAVVDVFLMLDNDYVQSTGVAGDTTNGVKVAITVTSDEIATTGLTINKASLALVVGDSAELEATVTPTNTTDELIWKSSDESVATVDNGVVKAKAAGNAEITVTSGTRNAVCKVVVSESQEQADAAQAALDAADAANKAAEAAGKAAAAATANPTAETVKAAQDAAAAASAAAKVAADAAAKAEALGETEAAKVATDAAAKATDAAAAATKAATDAQAKVDEAAKKSDGSAANTPAPVGNELKDTAGNAIGFVVTKATAGAAEAEYKGTDADKTAKKVTIPNEVKDQNGNVYKVTSIAANALKNAKGKEIVINKNIKKIGKNAMKGAKFTKITLKTDKKGKVSIGKGAFKTSKKATIKIKGCKGNNKDKLVKKVKKQANKKSVVK